MVSGGVVSRRFSLRRLEPSEALVSDAVIQALHWEVAQGRVSWFGRFNGGRLWVPPSRAATAWYWAYRLWINGVERKKGFSDIAGQLTNGKFFCFETKKPSVKRGTEEQEDFISHATGDNAVGGFVRSADEAVDMIRGAFK